VGPPESKSLTTLSPYMVFTNQKGDIMKIYFHSADLDGMCSGAIVKYKYPDAELIGINYGQQIDYDKILENEIIIMVDFSLQPFDEMIKLAQKVRMDKLIWIDHHKSAIEDAKETLLTHNDITVDFNGICPGIRIVGFAGCELTWNYFFPDQEMPEAIRLLGRYDVWDHSDVNTLPFQMGIRLEDTWPENQSMWSDYFSKFSDDLVKDTIKDGKLILKYQKQENEKYSKSCAFEAEFGGYKAICINKLLTNSQLFDSVYDPNKHDIMITFGLRKNGLWTMSFYTTKEDVDVSELARKFGGGGHRQASGATFDQLPLEFIRQIKKMQPIKYSPIPDYGDKMTINDFKENVDCGLFVDNDGHGYYATEDQITNLVVLPSDYFKNLIDERFSHVVWFNK